MVDQKIYPAFLSPVWPPQNCANGIVTATIQIVRALADRRCQSLIYACAGSSDSPDVHVLNNKQSFRGRLTNKLAMLRGVAFPPYFAVLDDLRKNLRAQAKAGKISIFEMEESFGWASSIAGRTRIPTIVRLHGPWFLTGAANGIDIGLPEHAQRILSGGKGIASADGVTAPSESVLQRTREFYGLELANARVIPNLVEQTVATQRWQQATAIPETILFVGRFDRLKGADVVIAAFASLAKQRKELVLHFCGPDTGYMDKSGHQICFERYVAQTIECPSIRKRIVNHGRQTIAEVAEHRKRAMITVVASRWETFGNVVQEAMSCGCPLVATRIGGIPEQIQHERNGLLAAVGDPAKLAEQIKRLLESPALAAQLGKQAGEDAEFRYAPQNDARATLDYYKNVIAIYRRKHGS